MKIGDKVVVTKKHTLINEFVGCVGTIIAEKIPNSQAYMLQGKTRWVVLFDSPVMVRKERVEGNYFWEDELVLYSDYVTESEVKV